MRSVDEHLDAVLAQIEPVPAVTLPVRRTLGLVTTADVRSLTDLPRFDNSSMDGYAVRRADLEGASSESPVVLPVTGDVAAGDPARHEMVPGQVWRIMTGAPMPEGADAVVKVEDTDGHPREPQLRVHPEEGAHVRRAGEDIRTGDLVMPAGSRIGAGEIAALLSAGVQEVDVVGPVRVAILSTGDELVRPGEPVGPGQIVDSNGPMLEALVRGAGAHVVHLGHLPDEEGATRRQLHRQLDHADVVITTGGVSKGEFDIVKKVLSGQGTMEFVEVAMQPGKPQGFGVLGRRDVPVFTLPGNPVSTLVSFEVFVRPALQRRAGRNEGGRRTTGLATTGWRSSPDRQTYTRVRIERDPTGAYAVSPAGGAGSHLVAALARADALAISDPEASEVTPGSEVELLLLRPRAEIDARLQGELEQEEAERAENDRDADDD
ncbi:gephyrin-like molybdotransferase Glp [uncultured Serinicoccus sp.]|uniref:molybdopterin molybdotransferase MoeA n=1 Tax=uncultured Serinicoccus sp. TaxID=735514 RepID=UPI0026127DF3|nr:gephyrin-like molybdotransferase Glp [uncultured Serinicoccus sp.]